MPIHNASASILRSLLRPAARFALRRGVKVRAILEELKGLLVEEARGELLRVGEEVSVSKLSVMTGLQRRDVQRVAAPIAEAPQQLDLLTRVIGAWCMGEGFSRGANPMDLSFEGSDSDFSRLVRGISSDLNPATVLFELERLNLVERRGQELRLLWNAYQISGDVDDAYTLLERDIAALIDGVDSNIKGAHGVPNLHISTRFDNVSVEALGRIREWILAKGAEFHAALREYVGSFDKDINPTRYSERGGAKVTIGSFSLCEAPEVVSDAD
ncbi:MAG: DUF6502 family protein [Pseudomonadota bacterium]